MDNSNGMTKEGLYKDNRLELLGHNLNKLLRGNRPVLGGHHQQRHSEHVEYTIFTYSSPRGVLRSSRRN